MISSTDFAKAGQQLLSLAQRKEIPYVLNGSSTKGMDCQGLVEYLYKQCGSPISYLGSNDMWRNLGRWQGTVEQTVKKFGQVPIGSLVFIWKETGAPARYKDNKGNASHVGVVIGKNKGIHASASRGRVAESTVKNKSINGGWNRVMLPKGIFFGQKVEQKVQATATDIQENTQAHQTRIAYITSANKDYVNIRKGKSTSSQRLFKANYGDPIQIIEEDGEWNKVIYNGEQGYVMAKFTTYSNPEAQTQTNNTEEIKQTLLRIASQLTSIANRV